MHLIGCWDWKDPEVQIDEASMGTAHEDKALFIIRASTFEISFVFKGNLLKLLPSLKHYMVRDV